jgi:hypothetical protein
MQYFLVITLMQQLHVNTAHMYGGTRIRGSSSYLKRSSIQIVHLKLDSWTETRSVFKYLQLRDVETPSQVASRGIRDTKSQICTVQQDAAIQCYEL